MELQSTLPIVTVSRSTSLNTMTLLWEHTDEGTHYSVRSAGESVRLYTNGVFHTQWNPRRPFSGGVWDCLSLPALYRSTSEQKRILVLGLGGGAVVRQLQLLVPGTHITAIEIDAVHIRIARQWFGITDSMVNVVESDAIEWLARYSGDGFDFIVDDLFGHLDSEVKRARQLDKQWLSFLGKSLNQQGTLVCNCGSMRELKTSLSSYRGHGFVDAFSWQLPNYDNAIGVFLRKPVASTTWVQNLRVAPIGSAARKQAQLIKRRRLVIS
jgi:spermidine synthase